MTQYINFYLTNILFVTSNLLLAYAAKQPVEPLIVNGRNTNIQECPYQVSIRRYGSHCCGGAIITPFHIVTAAHCLYPCQKSEIKKYYTVMAGSTIVWSGKSIPVRDCACHGNYSKTTGDYDIAVLKLAEKLHFSSKVKPIKLPPTKCKIKPGSSAVISGWGFTKEDGTMPQTLQKANVRICSPAMCAMAYAKYRNVTKNMICAGLVTKDNKVVDSCQGDSGGPMMQNDYLIGIISWGKGCAEPGFPGVYTNISKCRGWLLDNIKRLD